MRGDSMVVCPGCGSSNVRRLLSAFAVYGPEEETADRRPFLAPSWNDFRCIYRLTAGSLFGIVSGRPPFEMRAYTVEENGAIELNARVLVMDE